jgi:hypothetical protein
MYLSTKAFAMSAAMVAVCGIAAPASAEGHAPTAVRGTVSPTAPLEITSRQEGGQHRQTMEGRAGGGMVRPLGAGAGQWCYGHGQAVT